MRNGTLAAGLIGALVCIGFSSPGYATTVFISQESAPGAGDFSANQLGTIQSFSTAGTLAGFYAYASQQFTNTGSVGLTPDQSHLFLVECLNLLQFLVLLFQSDAGLVKLQT